MTHVSVWKDVWYSFYLFLSSFFFFFFSKLMYIGTLMVDSPFACFIYCVTERVS
jgi:hypothetical protein